MKAYALALGVVMCAVLLAWNATAAIALVVAAALGFLIDRTVAYSVFMLNRLSRRCRESLAHDTNRGDQSPEFDEQAVTLTDALSRFQHREEELLIAYDVRRCSQAEIALATSMRLQAEIALLRHRHMPKPFSQASRCGG